MTGIGSMGIGYGFDAAGNRTSDSTTTWVVNARGRVSQVRVISGATTYTYSYLINGQNLRVRKTGPSSVVPQGTQVFVYDEAGRLIGEYDNYGRARNEHVWLADRPVALIVYTYSGTSATPLTTTVYSVEADHLGTPRLITDSAQAQRWSWHSAPYGDTQPNQNPASKGTLVYNLRFPGQYFDKETNTHYNWHRDYESTTGRYIQSDPIGLAGGINTYTYVDGNPLLTTDELGLANDGGRRRPDSWWQPCNAAQVQQCKASCESQGREFESCAVRWQAWRGLRGGKPSEEAGPPSSGGLSCKCKDPSSDASAKCNQNCRQVWQMIRNAAGLMVLGLVWVCS
jgi:RHS repeat-associated protein